MQRISNKEELVSVLRELNAPSSNESRAVAEKLLKPFLKTPESMAGLLEIIKEHPDAGLRQLAAVIMKNRIPTIWKSLQTQVREIVKAQILQLATLEQLRLVRMSISEIIGAIAAIEIPSDSWKELAAFLMNCMKSEGAAQRELGLTLFNSLLSNTPKEISSLFNQMVQFFHNGLEDKEENVRSAAIKACGQLLNSITDQKQIPKFLTLINPIVKNLQHYVQLNDGSLEIVDDIFSLLNDIVIVQGKEFEKAITPLMQLMLEICFNTNLEMSLRDRASTVIGFAVHYNPNYIIKSKLTHPLITACLKLMTEPEEEDRDEDEVTAFSFSTVILDELVVSIPSKHTFKYTIEQCVGLMNQPNPLERKAGISALGLISEGCNEPMKANIGKFIPFAVKLFQDEVDFVREASISAVANFVEFLIPDIVTHYQDIMPIIMRGLDDSHLQVKEKSCIALEALCNVLKPRQIAPYLNDLMNMLHILLQRSNRDIQKAVLGAMANIARAAKTDFFPYFDSTINIMKQIMDSVDTTGLELRAKATECIGIIAESVGAEKFGPYIQYFMGKVLENFSYPSGHELAEYSFHFFGNIATILGVQFTPYLETVLSLMLENVKTLQSFNFDDEEEEEDEDDLEFSGSFQLNVRTSEIDEKGSAILNIGSIAKAVGLNFKPYFDTTMPLLLQYSNYPHPHIRRQITIALKCVVVSIVDPKILPNFEDKRTEDIVQNITEFYINTMIEDDDAETVARACEATASLCREIGVPAIAAHLDELVDAIIVLLKKEGTCNQSQLDEDEEEDHDLILIDAVSDLIDDVARCIGPNFVNHFKKIFPVLIKYLNHAALDDRTMAIGSLAEVCKALKENADPFVNEVFKFALQSANESHFNAKRNALFGLGVLAQNSPHKSGPHLNSIIKMAVPVLTEGHNLEEGLVDNACGCVSRLITYHTSAVPVDNLFPLLLKNLPLKEDFQENETVYTAIFTLIDMQHQAILNNFVPLLNVLGQVLGELNVSDSIQSTIVSKLKGLLQSIGEENMRNALSSVEPVYAAKISQALQ